MAKSQPICVKLKWMVVKAFLEWTSMAMISRQLLLLKYSIQFTLQWKRTYWTNAEIRNARENYVGDGLKINKCSQRHLWLSGLRIIAESLELEVSSAKKPLFSEINRRARFEFARRHLNRIMREFLDPWKAGNDAWISHFYWGFKNFITMSFFILNILQL